MHVKDKYIIAGNTLVSYLGLFSTHLSLDYKINYLEKVFPPLCHLHKWPPGPTDCSSQWGNGHWLLFLTQVPLSYYMEVGGLQIVMTVTYHNHVID